MKADSAEIAEVAQQTEPQVTEPRPADPLPPRPEPQPPAIVLKDDWLRDFYKECGREVTLAYTTLNQMKNWAITVQAAIVAGIVSFSRGVTVDQLAFPLLAGSVLAYVFTLRFFVRAILCYINLSRWNRLQASILELKLLTKDQPSIPPRTPAQLEQRLISDIQDFYYGWLAPLDRSAQIASTLKLGFGILTVVPILLIVYSMSFAWQDSLAQALIAFSVGGTIIEARDFLSSSYFDTPAAAKARGERGKGQPHRTFPTHSADVNYIVQWIMVLGVSAIISLRPWIVVWWTGIGPLPGVK